MRMLNLGCGTKTSRRPEVINIDWSIYLRIKQNKIIRPFVSLALRGSRLERFNALSEHVMAHDLTKGIPFDSDSVDAVYHSHMLEHLDRDVAKDFVLEVKRVLKPGGIHRIVVPDFGLLCRRYLASFDKHQADPNGVADHESTVSEILEQCVRREAHGSSLQSPLRRKVENLLLGDARKRGETHQWMYDRITLPGILSSSGYVDITVQNYDSSYIPDWTSYELDVDENGKEYKPGSLYIDARKRG